MLSVFIKETSVIDKSNVKQFVIWKKVKVLRQCDRF